MERRAKRKRGYTRKKRDKRRQNKYCAPEYRRDTSVSFSTPEYLGSGIRHPGKSGNLRGGTQGRLQPKQNGLRETRR